MKKQIFFSFFSLMLASLLVSCGENNDGGDESTLRRSLGVDIDCDTQILDINTSIDKVSLFGKFKICTSLDGTCTHHSAEIKCKNIYDDNGTIRSLVFQEFDANGIKKAFVQKGEIKLEKTKLEPKIKNNKVEDPTNISLYSFFVKGEINDFIDKLPPLDDINITKFEKFLPIDPGFVDQESLQSIFEIKQTNFSPKLTQSINDASIDTVEYLFKQRSGLLNQQKYYIYNDLFNIQLKDTSLLIMKILGIGPTTWELKDNSLSVKNNNLNKITTMWRVK